MWDDLKYPAQGIDPPVAASDPTRDTNDGMLLFSATQPNIIAGGALMPHGWKLGSMIEPHIHWTPTDNTAGDVVWLFQWSVAAIGDVFPAMQTVQIAQAANGLDRHQLASFGLININCNALGCMLKWKLTRVGNASGDTYASTAKLLEFDIHTQFDGIGSQEQYTKAD